MIDFSTRRKKWVIERSIKNHPSRRDRNDSLEFTYNLILKAAKRFIAKLPDEASRKVFERDYKHDSSESLVAMHSFLSPNIYWSLDCDYLYEYQIEYSFYNCSFEAEIQELIWKEIYYTKNCNPKSMNHKEFYNGVLKV